jgi:predicted permease
VPPADRAGDMTEAFDIVLPIFAFVAVGWALAVAGILQPSVGEGLASFAATVGIPLLLFETLANADLGAASPWQVWACYYPAAAVTWFLGQTISRRLFGLPAPKAIIAGMGATFANIGFVGLPLTHRAFGEHGFLVATMVISIHLPIWMTTATVLLLRAEAAEGAATSRARAIGRVALAVLRNPIILGLIAGAIAHFVGYRPSGVLERTIHTLGGVASPVALVSLGMSMHGQSLRGEVAPALTMAMLKLLALPALVLVTCRIAGADDDIVGPLVMVGSVPTGINVYLVATQFGVGRAIASNVVAVTTVLAALTASAWLILIGHP